jgi:hypothetical protein
VPSQIPNFCLHGDQQQQNMDLKGLTFTLLETATPFQLPSAKVTHNALTNTIAQIWLQTLHNISTLK